MMTMPLLVAHQRFARLHLTPHDWKQSMETRPPQHQEVQWLWQAGEAC